ncbi:ABC transporter ATP-binding protein [Streptosporangium sp. NBC_01755]|uniref:ABC transporter ATP-binding protein n=1 Tax=unclassified Streptosporangium TaxID=2632669 RepID=UPI002DDBD99C|nr:MULTISPECIES: ABC transporter ATP-binding protein [unclassified Streptosporangium]WSA26966.1 ABC transporter ATP-binding protein [Streptosporangium sp. NBC_01810]WSD01623.1 ABC transporter ATP-binding protein [Streptosporangium sp. NBC_01755]
MTAVVETEGLTKFYGVRRGLEDLDLEIRPGEVFGYLGPNGAGKTTTIRLLLDVIRPTRGRMTVLGHDPRDAGVRSRIGYLPGELALEGREKARDYLAFLGTVRGGLPRGRIEELAERLEADLAVPMGKLSKGNKQKVGLIQAFMHEPEFLILDEPTSGLDPLVQQEFLAMVREVRASGRTVLMSSHVLAEVEHVSDRVGIVRAGRLVTVEDISALREKAVRRVEFHFDAPVPREAFENLPGVRDLRVEGAGVRCTIDGRPDALVKAAAKFTVVHMVSAEPDLEEIFLTYYSEEEAPHARAGVEEPA